MQYTQEQLTVILDNHKRWLRGNSDGVRANLRGADLSGADLSRADLSGADLSGANLYRAILSGANLSNTNLYRADLSGADLSGADLSRADLSGANLRYANLRYANLSRADLSNTILSGANLSNTKSDYSILLSLSGMRWGIVIKDDMVKVGCQEYTYKQWKEFSREEVMAMDSDAIEFYDRYLINTLDCVFDGTKFEIK